MKKDAPLAKKEYIMPADLMDVPIINTARIETQNLIKNGLVKIIMKDFIL